MRDRPVERTRRAKEVNVGGTSSGRKDSVGVGVWTMRAFLVMYIVQGTSTKSSSTEKEEPERWRTVGVVCI